MRKQILIPSLIFLVIIVFFYGLSVGMYKVFPYEFLDSSEDTLSGKITIGNNQYVNQPDIDSLIKIDNNLEINLKMLNIVLNRDYQNETTNCLSWWLD